uniref:SHOCT domain-containing protein n=1 Tax=Streptomyces polyasparticus TaxID=2767826 RepID=UPI0027B8F82D|nr:SHOCT domain-containing protein [Streptomyces polyasparticus]
MLFLRSGNQPDRPGISNTAEPRPVPEQPLAERHARGEIDEDEYRRHLAVLHSAGRTPIKQ